MAGSDEWQDLRPAFADEDLGSPAKLSEFCHEWRMRLAKGVGPVGNVHLIWLNLRHAIWNAIYAMARSNSPAEPPSKLSRREILNALSSVIDWCELQDNRPDLRDFIAMCGTRYDGVSALIIKCRNGVTEPAIPGFRGMTPLLYGQRRDLDAEHSLRLTFYFPTGTPNLRQQEVQDVYLELEREFSRQCGRKLTLDLWESQPHETVHRFPMLDIDGNLDLCEPFAYFAKIRDTWAAIRALLPAVLELAVEPESKAAEPAAGVKPPQDPAGTDEMRRVVNLYTSGVADDRLTKVAKIVGGTGTADTKLWAIDAEAPIPATASAQNLGGVLGVSHTAIQKTSWWRQKRKGNREESAEKRLTRHRGAADED